jgi:hypothetical protein
MNIYRLPVLLFAVVLSAASAFAEPVKLKVSAILELHAGLTALDGYQKEIPQGRDQNGAERPSLVMPVGYKFPPAAKWAIADDLAAVKRAKDTYDAAVLATVKAVSPDGTGESIDKSPVLKAKFSDEVRKLQDLEQTLDLKLLTREDLNLDANSNIPGTVLTWLSPILKKP